MGTSSSGPEEGAPLAPPITPLLQLLTLPLVEAVVEAVTPLPPLPLRPNGEDIALSADIVPITDPGVKPLALSLLLPLPTADDDREGGRGTGGGVTACDVCDLRGRRVSGATTCCSCS